MELAKEYEKRSAKHQKKPLALIIGVVILILALGSLGTVYFLYNQGIASVSNKTNKILIRIPNGANTKDVSQILYQKGLIRSEWAFVYYARIHKADGSLKAGEFYITPNLSAGAILELLKSGATATYNVTIPEGYNTKQIAEVFSKKKLINYYRFMDIVANGRFDYDFLQGAPTGEKRLEGFLFPDTYKIEIGTKEEDIINMMLQRFQKENTPELRAKAKALNLSVRQVVTLASIIEREAKTAEDRPLVSAVFHNRLKINMKLESCATVQYIIGDPNKKVLSYKDIAVISPYNTYKNPGLPAGPIASPGKASLVAAINPANVKYLYFVAKPDGSNQFSNTAKEHEAAKKKYVR